MAEDKLLKIQDVAELLLVDSTTVRRWILTGVLDAVLLPCVGSRRHFRIKQSTIKQLLSRPITPLTA